MNIQLQTTKEMKESIERMVEVYHNDSDISVWIHGILFVDVEAKKANLLDWRFVTRIMRSVPTAEILAVHPLKGKGKWRCRIIIPIREGDCSACGESHPLASKYSCPECGYLRPAPSEEVDK